MALTTGLGYLCVGVIFNIAESGSLWDVLVKTALCAKPHHPRLILANDTYIIVAQTLRIIWVIRVLFPCQHHLQRIFREKIPIRVPAQSVPCLSMASV